MNLLSDWVRHLESLHYKGQDGIELGLERVARVKAVLGHAPFCPVIIVGGTNGKGSTCAMLEAIYRAAAYRVGCYTSPHLLEYNERVRLDGQAIDDAALCAAFARVEAARQAAGGVALTYFEFGTLAAWEAFVAARVEVMILEVGLGGRLDAVNVYEPDCSIVTGIALDHVDWLGSTREAIGFEKAGIFRAGKAAICADADAPRRLVAQAQAIGADLHLIGPDFSLTRNAADWSLHTKAGHLTALPFPALRGDYQLSNAAAALLATQVLQPRLPVALSAIHAALRSVRLPGRFEQAGERPILLLDVAHNPQAMAALAHNLAAQPCVGRTLAVVGMLSDKDIAGALAALCGKIDVWLLATLAVPRGATADVLARAVAPLGGRVELFASPELALQRAVGLAGEDDRIAAFGSFYTVAAVKRVLQTVKNTVSPP